MPGSTRDEPGTLLGPLLDDGCSPWITSSQHVADLYDLGVKLWRKEDLLDIEKQLAQSRTAESFSVRRIDGSVIHIKNPMFGVQKPIWTPYVRFQEYWRLVRIKPDGPAEKYLCTYFPDWTNQAVQNYEGPFENLRLLFETRRERWQASKTCEVFTSQFRELLAGDGNRKRVTKIICFGLGDLNTKPPDWWRKQNESAPKDQQVEEIDVVEGALMHHAIALTIADITRSCTHIGDTGIRLLTQDPQYKTETKELLQDIGFEVVGEYGAGGFAELDDEVIVFSPFTSAPVKQIIADFARPVAIIQNGKSAIKNFGDTKSPYRDPESPRTMQMWKGYEKRDFPIPSEDVKLDGSLHQLAIYARIEV